MNDNLNPIFPCICGHLINTHGDVGGGYRWSYDSEGNEQEEQEQPRPVCWGCGPGDCYFVEMTNLEFLEWKSDNENKNR